MNESNQTPTSPSQPVVAPPLPPIHGPRQLGEDPAEREPISGLFVTIEAVLRQPRRLLYQLRQPGAGRLIVMMLFVALICSSIYGVIVGSFSGGEQWWAAPVKVVTGLLVSALICLPSLYIFTCLGGSQARLQEIIGLVTGLLMLMTILLVGFAPVAWLFSQSTNEVAWMGFLHLLFWGISTGFGLRLLNVGFAHARSRSSAGVNIWALIFVLVALQMSTALRPLVGPAGDNFLPTEKKFFIKHWIDSTK